MREHELDWNVITSVSTSRKTTFMLPTTTLKYKKGQRFSNYDPNPSTSN